MRAPLTRLFTLSLISGLLAACAGTKDSVLPSDGPTMKAIYDAHFDNMNGSSIDGARAAVVDRPLSEDRDVPDGYVRSSQQELDAHFPRLPNPTLVMYVFPHLAGPARVPVPGYATTFPLYESVEYALPGEVPNSPRPSSMTPKVSP